MDAPSSPNNLPRRFRWLQFSLRTLLLAILAAALGVAWYGREMRRRERIERAIDLLAVAPSIHTIEYDPIALVRAVNGLHALGKEDCIVTLRRFAARYPSGGDFESPHMALDVVVPLLFDRADPEDESPPSLLHLDSDWSGYLSVQSDIPFQHSARTLFEGDKIDLIDWAEREGRLRDSPLRPANDPLAAAEAAIQAWLKSPRRDPYNWRDVQRQPMVVARLREQGLRCVADLVDLKRSELPDVSPSNEAEWIHIVNECHRLGIRWSEEQQKYVATKGAP